MKHICNNVLNHELPSHDEKDRQTYSTKLVLAPQPRQMSRLRLLQYCRLARLSEAERNHLVANCIAALRQIATDGCQLAPRVQGWKESAEVLLERSSRVHNETESWLATQRQAQARDRAAETERARAEIAEAEKLSPELAAWAKKHLVRY